jgi:predicted ATPase
MQSIRIKNLRSLQDTGEVNIKPITMLVGSNSSGKSTFIRSFPLLRQSVQTSTVGAILWFGNYVDFGTHDEAKNRYTETDEISFSFTYELDAKENGSFINLLELIEGNYQFKLELIIDSNSSGQSKTKSIKIEFEDHTIFFSIGDNNSIDFLKINDTQFDIAQYNIKIYKNLISFLPELVPMANLYEKIHDVIRKYNRKGISENQIASFFQEFKLGSSTKMLEHMKQIKKDTKIWNKKVNTWSIQSKDFIELRDALILSGLFDIFKKSNKYLSLTALNSRYIAPLRAQVERYYRMQDLSVDEVDFQGQNLAMYLYALSTEKRKNIKIWSLEHFGFYPLAKKNGGHVSLSVEFKNGEVVNVSDLGFGFSQVLPILVQLWSIINIKKHTLRKSIPYIFAIEQPELHLHPAMQAQLADILIKVSNTAKERLIDLRLLIETHSETIINRLGIHIYNKTYDENNISILVFNKRYNDKYSSITFANYTQDGYLENWPYGFFEPESDLI